jgi:uncharacterized membrane protein
MSATLTVWKFDNAEGAGEAAELLKQLSKQDLIHIHDAAVVTWPVDKKRPKTRQLDNVAAGGALSGAFWGLLFGLLFFVPFIGMAVGAATGALAGSLVDVGIDDDFINSVKDEVVPGTSALFLMSSDAVIDSVHDAFGNTHAALIRTNLSNAQEDQLRSVFDDT